MGVIFEDTAHRSYGVQRGEPADIPMQRWNDDEAIFGVADGSSESYGMWVK